MTSAYTVLAGAKDYTEEIRKKMRLCSVQEDVYYANDASDIHTLLTRPGIKGRPIKFSYGQGIDPSGLLDHIISEDLFVETRKPTFVNVDDYTQSECLEMVRLTQPILADFLSGRRHEYAGYIPITTEFYDFIGVAPPHAGTDRSLGQPRLWIGSGETPLHHDTSDNFVYNLYGEKDWLLMSPIQAELLNNSIIGDGFHVYDDVPTLEIARRHLDKDSYSVVRLGPGDALFVPAAWVHLVKAHSPSIAINSWVDKTENGPIFLAPDTENHS